MGGLSSQVNDDGIRTERVLMSLKFSLPRTISLARDIPIVRSGSSSMSIGLVGVSDFQGEITAEASRHGGQWRVERRDPFPFYLDACLPRFAKRTIVPEVVDLIPAGSWFASLANLLVASSWKALRDPFIMRSGACEECGDPHSLEGHERWTYDERDKTQSLDTIRCMCSRCHATQHLGRANVIGNFDGVFGRLCALNRITPREREDYRNAIFSKFEDRSRHDWAIDVSSVFDHVPSLALKADVLFGGDGWIWRPGKNGAPDTSVRLVGVSIGSDGKRLHLVPSDTVLEST